MRWPHRASMLGAGLLVLALGMSGAAAGASSGASSDAWRAELARRLQALEPSRPSDYIALAEEVVDHAAGTPTQDADRALARRLAALAGAIDPRGSGRSAALLLAELAQDDADRARMAAVAAFLDPSADAREAGAMDSDAVLSLVRAFAHYRRGEAQRARDALARGQAAALLDRHPEILQGGSARFRADCDAMRTSGPPAMGAEQLDALQALTASALAGGPRSWSEAIAQGGLAPLAEVDLADPGAVFGVDPAECLWRDGGWVRVPRAPR
ncbi:MAG: hypothetical protein FJ260_06810 [Planctomycetes bacterium]|nr:hypothetical protein [Planctomycetota bacterium]